MIVVEPAQEFDRLITQILLDAVTGTNQFHAFVQAIPHGIEVGYDQADLPQNVRETASQFFQYSSVRVPPDLEIDQALIGASRNLCCRVSFSAQNLLQIPILIAAGHEVTTGNSMYPKPPAVELPPQ